MAHFQEEGTVTHLIGPVDVPGSCSKGLFNTLGWLEDLLLIKYVLVATIVYRETFLMTKVAIIFSLFFLELFLFGNYLPTQVFRDGQV